VSGIGADAAAAGGDAGERESLEAYLKRPLSPAEPDVLSAIDAGPIDPARALALADVQRLLDPAPLAAETGWCTLADGVAYVAVRTAMPTVTAEMVDWWFDWHPRESLRYCVWHPEAHRANSLTAPARAGAKAHWGAVHRPVEDVGVGIVHARIAFARPSEMGMADDALEHSDVATIVCAMVGDERRRMRHTPMFHVFLRDRDSGGVVLRSGFWLGAAIRPYGLLGGVGERLLNNRRVRQPMLPARLPRALATHCAEEYANLAELLPELYARFGPPAR
jgi:DAPG hydrolase PhiG domain